MLLGSTLTVSDYAALSVPVLSIIGFIGRVISNKLNKVGEHLERQDTRGQRIERRMIRVETKLGLDPLPPERD